MGMLKGLFAVFGVFAVSAAVWEGGKWSCKEIKKEFDRNPYPGGGGVHRTSHAPDDFSSPSDPDPSDVPFTNQDAVDDLHRQAQEVVDLYEQGVKARSESDEIKLNADIGDLFNKLMPFACPFSELSCRNYENSTNNEYGVILVEINQALVSNPDAVLHLRTKQGTDVLACCSDGELLAVMFRDSEGTIAAVYANGGVAGLYRHWEEGDTKDEYHLQLSTLRDCLEFLRRKLEHFKVSPTSSSGANSPPVEDTASFYRWLMERGLRLNHAEAVQFVPVYDKSGDETGTYGMEPSLAARLALVTDPRIDTRITLLDRDGVAGFMIYLGEAAGYGDQNRYGFISFAGSTFVPNSMTMQTTCPQLHEHIKATPVDFAGLMKLVS